MIGKLKAVSKFAGIKIEGDDNWYNPTKESKEEYIKKIDALRTCIGQEVNVKAVDGEYTEIEVTPTIDEDIQAAKEQGVYPKEPDKLGETESGVPTGAGPTSKADNKPVQGVSYISQWLEDNADKTWISQRWNREYFKELLKIKCNVEKKAGLNYISWADAWVELKKIHPDAIYKVYENSTGMPYFYDNTGAFVKVGVTICGIEHISYLPVMDFKNKSIAPNAITTFEINKAIQRAFTKAIAMHGMGTYVYQGEDLPEEAK